MGGMWNSGELLNCEEANTTEKVKRCEPRRGEGTKKTIRKNHCGDRIETGGEGRRRRGEVCQENLFQS
jgi:hypothetical protein